MESLKIVYTPSALSRMDSLCSDYRRLLEEVVRDKVHYSADELAEVTAADVMVAMRSIKTVKKSSLDSQRTLAAVYIYVGVLVTVYGAFWDSINAVLVGHPVQGALILSGVGVASIGALLRYFTKRSMRRSYGGGNGSTVDYRLASLSSLSENVKNYSTAIAFADTALCRTSMMDIQPAIDLLSSIEVAFPLDRTLHIYLGRLYRRLGDYDHAILILRKFIENINIHSGSGGDNKVDIADAYYNIACYHALKAVDAQETGLVDEGRRLVKETLESLGFAIDGHEANREAASEDEDFRSMKEELRQHFGIENACD